MTLKESNENESSINCSSREFNQANKNKNKNAEVVEPQSPPIKNSFSKRIMDSKIVKIFTTGWIMQVRNFCKLVVNNSTVSLTIVGLIFANAIMLGVDTYIPEDNIRLKAIFQGIDTAFLSIFTFELIIQFIAHLLQLFLDPWLVFDFVIIVLSWIAQNSPVSVFRVFRAFRAFRLITRVKTMKQLVSAIFSVLPSIAAILLLLVLLFYIFAVMFTELFGDMNDEYEVSDTYFKNLWRTLFTLFQIMTFDGWGEIAIKTQKGNPLGATLIFLFLFITGLIVLNLIIAVICDAVSNAGEDVKEKIHGSFDEDDDEVDSEETMKLVRERMLGIEEQLDSLEQLQERNIHTLEYLARQLKQRKNAHSLTRPY